MGKLLAKTEARIIIYLSVADKLLCNVTAIAHKMELDYYYISKVLLKLHAMGYLTRIHKHHKVFYELTATAPLKEAKARLIT